jgi:hypothetical protein
VTRPAGGLASESTVQVSGRAAPPGPVASGRRLPVSPPGTVTPVRRLGPGTLARRRLGHSASAAPGRPRLTVVASGVLPAAAAARGPGPGLGTPARSGLQCQARPAITPRQVRRTGTPSIGGRLYCHPRGDETCSVVAPAQI